MSFIAGIINLSNQKIRQDIIQRFNIAVAKVYKSIECPWEIQKVNLEECILVCADTDYMWEGSKKIENSDFAAVATGAQWKRIPSFKNALEYLAIQFACKKTQIGNYFDYFSFAIFDKKKNRYVLATDPLGISQVVYYVDDTTLVFSSHQSFIRCYLGSNITICWDALFEYLLIHHLLGNKTLMEGVKVLPPGCRLGIQGSDCRIISYTKIEDIQVNNQMRVEEACELIWSYLDKKFHHYASLAKKDFIALLSGGWDTRLIAAFLARTGRLRQTFTTEQGVKIGGEYVSEGKIAKKIAKLIGTKNYFIARKVDWKQEDLYKLAILNDYTNDFHGWALSLSEGLPRSEYIVSDGFLGGMLIRGTYTSDEMQRCIGEGNKEKVVELILTDYVAGVSRGGSIGTVIHGPDAESWKQVLDPRFITDSIERLKKTISGEVQDIHCDNFMTVYQLRNRQRRCISWLPIGIFGRKGAVILPFCDQEFVKMTSAIPNEMKWNQSLYKCLLEKTKSGLSEVPSTNTKDIDKLQPYFAEKINGMKLRKEMLIKKWFQKKYPKGYNLTRKIKRKMVSFLDSAKKKDLIIEETLKDPPAVLMDIFSADLKKAIRNRNKEEIKKYCRYVHSILPVERFLTGKI